VTLILNPKSFAFCVRGEHTPLLTWLGLVDCSIQRTSGRFGWCVPVVCPLTIFWGHFNRVWTAFLWVGDTSATAITCMVITRPKRGSVF